MIRTRRLGISLTPMIDVVFLLLLFFLLTTQLQSTSAVPLRASLASGATGTVPELLEIGGDLVLNGKVTSMQDWQNVLRANAPKTLAIRPENDVNLSRLMSIVDEARAAGWNDITLVEGAQ